MPRAIGVAPGDAQSRAMTTDAVVLRRRLMVAGCCCAAGAFAWRAPAVQSADAVGAGRRPAQGASAAVPARIVDADPSNYLALLRTLEPGDTLVLAPGPYDNPDAPPGLPIFDLHGTAAAPITITGPETGPRPVFVGRGTHNTVRIANASHIVVRNLDVDGRNLGGDGVNGQGPSHHITLENLGIRGIGPVQGVVGISTNRAPAWYWTIRGCTIVGAGTGMYLGNSDGRNPFVAGIIERNLVRDTLGYNVQIKHQVAWPDLPGLPAGRTVTIIRDNVFAKAANGSTGPQARPNVLVGDVPPSGRGSANGYEIYRNRFFANPTEALLQVEGNVAIHANVFVNDTGAAINVQPHNGRVRDILILGNTVVASGHGIAIRGGDPSYAQRVVGNAVFAAVPIAGGMASDNVTGSRAEAAQHLASPLAVGVARDFRPKPGALEGAALDVRDYAGLAERDRDCAGRPRDWSIRGACGVLGGAAARLPAVGSVP